MKENAFWRFSILLGLITPVALTDAADEVENKSRYNLFNPTPANLLRELATDRPDKTEGPTTVDAGHCQFEMDFATLTYDRTDGVQTKSWNIAAFNIRVGLLNNVELSLIFESYLRQAIDDRPVRTMSILSGVGDFITRLKINLWGDDGGQTAFALFPFVKFPTSTGGLGTASVEGGAIFPFSVKLPAKVDMGMETGFSFLRNESGGNYHEEFVNSVTFTREIIGKLSGYCEFFSSASTEHDSEWIGTVDLGVTYALTENLQLDCACNINAFSGISVRF